MEPSEIKAAAELLSYNRLALRRLEGLPPHLTPADENDAYAIQAEVNDRLAAAFGPRTGWKIGCTTSTMRRFLSIAQPCAGEMFRRFMLPSIAEVPRRCFVRPGVECEIAVELAKPLAGRTREEVADCVWAVQASIEIVDDRYEDYAGLGVRTLIADNFFNAGCVLGPPVTAWRELDLAALEGGMWVNGTKIGGGRGADILGHPLEALAWLARRLAQLGREVPAGAVVTLGSLVQTAWVSQGDNVEIEIGGLGAARVRFV